MKTSENEMAQFTKLSIASECCDQHQAHSGNGSVSRSCFSNEEMTMRFTAISIAAALTIGAAATSVLAQQSTSFDSCSSLAEQRGAGAESGRRNHTEFMRECLAGKIPVTVGGPASAPAPAAHLDSYNKCEALAEQRGSGTDSGLRNHREFMTQCMAGTIR
jgi:hypothetical protein